jgi:putative FmdB family regulatory protein
MPTYEYRCALCNALMILMRPVDERDNLVTCPSDDQEMMRQISAVPVHFKSGGFYKTGG